MNLVHPIKDLNTVAQFKAKLKEKNYRDYMVFTMGINVGLRISDLLPLRVEQLLDKQYLEIVEEKTNKPKRFLINSQIQNEIKMYVEALGLEPSDYMFNSRFKGKHLSRIQCWRVLEATAKELGIEGFGTHSLRKTFGYHHFKRNKDLAMLQKIFNHSSQSVTLAYIGLTDEEIDKTIEDFFI